MVFPSKKTILGCILFWVGIFLFIAFIDHTESAEPGTHVLFFGIAALLSCSSGVLLFTLEKDRENDQV